MVPCPWARDAAAMYRGEDVGVHLTLNSRVEQLPLGSDHALAEPARRRRRLPAHGRGRVGSRRPRRGAQGVPGPGRAGDLLGLRRVAPRQPHGHDAAAPRLLRRVPRDRGRLRPAAAHGAGGGRAPDRLPVPPARRARKASCSPITSCTRASGLACRSEPLFVLAPGVTEIYVHPARRHRRAARFASRLGESGSTTTRSSRPTRRFAELIATSGATLIGYRALRELQRSEQRAAVVADPRRARRRCARPRCPRSA